MIHYKSFKIRRITTYIDHQYNDKDILIYFNQIKKYYFNFNFKSTYFYIN